MPHIVQYILELIIHSYFGPPTPLFLPHLSQWLPLCLFSIRYRDLSWAIGSHDYGGWEVPQSAVCKLEVQGNQWCGSHLQDPGPRMRAGSQGGVTAEVPGWVWRSDNSQEHWRLRVEDGYPSSNPESNFALLLTFSLFRPSTGWTMPTRTGEGNFFHSIYWFKCKFLWKHPHRHTQK